MGQASRMHGSSPAFQCCAGARAPLLSPAWVRGAQDGIRFSKGPMIGLAYCDTAGRIFFDPSHEPLADGGVVREVRRDELIPAPPGSMPMVLPGRHPRVRRGSAKRRSALAMVLPAGYTRLLLPAYERDGAAPALPLFGYCYACVIDDELYVAAMRTDESEDWQPRHFESGELERIIDRRVATDPRNR